MGFLGGSTGKEPACNEGDLGLVPGLGKAPGERNDFSLQYSSLENSMDCLVQGVTKSRTRLSDFHFHFLIDHCLTQGHEDLCLCFLLQVTFRSLIQLEVLFAYAMRKGSNSILHIQLFWHYLLRNLFFPQCICLGPLLKSKLQ